jgi:hypothetical protein
MSQPQLDFAATEGEASTGLSGPDTLEGDLRELANMFDPGAVLKSGQSGGLTHENIKSDPNNNLRKIYIFTEMPGNDVGEDGDIG